MKYSESNRPLVCMMTQSTCYKGTSKMQPLGVLWHSTGANNPTLRRYVQPDDNAQNRDELIALIGKNSYGNDWNHITRQAGLNAWIGKLADGTITSVQTMPWDYKPWGCGAGEKGSCNNGWMQFEICEDDLTSRDYFEKAYNEACELTAYYCKMYNLNPKGTVQFKGVTVPVILDHKTSYKLGLGGNHGDVQHWFAKYGKTLDDVRNDVAKLMAEDGSYVAPDTAIDGEYTKGQSVQLSKNFSSTEFDCHGKGCCSITHVDQKLVELLQNIREHFNKPVNVSSGYRCAIHNKNVGGATGSRHAKGQAADIYITGVKPVEIARYAEQLGILGIGLYETDADGHFVHVDTRETKSFWYGQAQEKRTTFIEKPAESIPQPQEPELEMYRIRKSWDDAKSQIGAYRNLDGAKKACDAAGPEYKIYNSKGEQVYPEVQTAPDASKVNTSAIDAEKMWNYFLKSGMNEYGVAGVMGNLYAESGLRPCNLQNTYEKSLGMTDAEYTAYVDANYYTNFVKDSAGYGLAQWTYWTLKRDMLAYHQSKNKSIGDGDTQMEFLVHQLSTQYTSVWKILTTAKTVREASDAMLLKFERPADQSEAVQKARASYGQKYFDKYAKKEPENPVVGIEENDLVSLTDDAVYYTGKEIPGWVKSQKWYVKQVEGDRAVIDKSEDGKSSINSPVNVKHLVKVEKEPEKPAPTQPVSNPTLRRGDKNDAVKTLQTRLKELGFDCDGIDGSFGPITEKQVKAFQTERGLDDDGVCGPLTWKAINSFAEYDVVVDVNLLNVRTGPSTSKYSVKFITKFGEKHTIVFEKNGWGKIKNGVGWFYLAHTKKI